MHASSHNFSQSRTPLPLGVPAPLSLPLNGGVVNSYSPYNMAPNIPPPSPSATSAKALEEHYANLPDPSPVSRVWEGLVWALEVVQQPIRARMCGFGDKDRRPISPPPCVRLIIFNPETGEEIDYTKVVDLSRLVLNVDLWNDDGRREDNCVRHVPNAAAIGSGGISPYTPVPASGNRSQIPSPYNGGNIPYSSHNFPSPNTVAPNPMGSYFPEDPSQYGNNGGGYNSRTPSFSGAPYSNGYGSLPVQPIGGNPSSRSSQDFDAANKPPESQLTDIAKNLIGSASSSAFRLYDETGKIGLWFVLQDLSVRTEGHFRLKMNFFNLSEFVLADPDNKVSSEPGELLTEAPCLATVFSKVFHVFSAKKFPGVIETTPLSRQFAKQGIKIPIRKDGPKKRKANDEGDEEEEDDEAVLYD